MAKPTSILAELYPELNDLRKRARSQRKPKSGSNTSLDTLRVSLDDIFGDIKEEMNEIQSPNPITSARKKRDEFNFLSPEKLENDPIDTVSQPVPEPVSHCETGCLTHCLTNGLTDGLTYSETVSQHETHSDTVSPCNTVSPCETMGETISFIHPNKLRFLAYVLASKKPGNPWRFTVRNAAAAIGIKYITVRNYPKFCYDRGWFKYRTIKSAAWQGIEVEWMDRNIEDMLLKQPVSLRGTPCETHYHKAPVSHCETVSETVSHCETLDTPLDRKNKDLSILKITASSLEQKKLLTFTDEDVIFFYPHLAKIGFGSVQLRQIVEKLEKTNKSVDKVFEGMEHVNFELSRGHIIAAGGLPVDQPLGYVFRALATTGYYRRPEGYISGAEQAERDAMEEFKRLADVRKEREEAEFEAWLIQLTPEERTWFLKGQMGPERQWLKQKWREQKLKI